MNAQQLLAALSDANIPFSADDIHTGITALLDRLPTPSLDRYTLQNAVEKVDGYCGFAHPSTSADEDFRKAKIECLGHLRRQMLTIEQLDHARFRNVRCGREGVSCPGN